MIDIRAWLAAQGLEQYASGFAENAIDGELLPSLTADDLREIGVTALGHRKKLMAAIAALCEDLAPATSNAPSPAQAPAATPATAERRQLTVMFVDLVGSTALSARLDPEEMGSVLRGYQNAVAGEIARFEGHVAKFMGDGVLAYFGWPFSHEDEAERAVRAGLAIVAAVARLGGGRAPFACRIGVATGLVVVGELIGEGVAQEQMVVGDTPNLAARWPSRAPKPHSCNVATPTKRPRTSTRRQTTWPRPRTTRGCSCRRVTGSGPSTMCARTSGPRWAWPGGWSTRRRATRSMAWLEP
jgi:class 3 adenylate cyclase